MSTCEKREHDWIREFVVTNERDLNADWNCIGRKAFFCGFCGHDFELGDEFRMVFTNDLPGCGGNPLTCKPCWDANGGFEGARMRWQQMWSEYKTKFKWWARR